MRRAPDARARLTVRWPLPAGVTPALCLGAARGVRRLRWLLRLIRWPLPTAAPSTAPARSSFFAHLKQGSGLHVASKAAIAGFAWSIRCRP
jgi:hypothetical protein